MLYAVKGIYTTVTLRVINVQSTLAVYVKYDKYHDALLVKMAGYLSSCSFMDLDFFSVYKNAKNDVKFRV